MTLTSDWLSTSMAVRLEKPALQTIIDRLASLGYEVVGPRIKLGAIVYGNINSIEELPLGYLDDQKAATYRLIENDQAGYFDYVVGPHSLKNYLFPSCQTISRAKREENGWHFKTPAAKAKPIAVIGVRSCDLHAMRIQDRVFLGGQFVDEAYQAQREALFLLAINCRRAAATCFCHSLGTGPAIGEECDLALTEMDDHFVAEIGSSAGCQALATTDLKPCTQAELEAARAVPQRLAQEMHQQSHADSPKGRRQLDAAGVHDLLLSNLTHPQWQAVAERCLACGNCTMVCPTCFCSSVEEVSDLTGEETERRRHWDSCFTAEHSRMHSGTVRSTTASRYRQWLTHKLATWIDQFDESGCVGCGRCITWCPVGIDLTEEVAAIRDTDSRSEVPSEASS